MSQANGSLSRKTTIQNVVRVMVVAAAIVSFLVAAWIIGKDLLHRSRSDVTDTYVMEEGKLRLWWGEVPTSLKQASLDTGTHNNIERSSYAGPESCRKCHPKNYSSWSEHSHRWMNALADESSVKGDFGEQTRMDYLGGQAFFYRDNDEYRMRLVRDDKERIYTITQTIGWRFFQYYVGKQVTGPEAVTHHFYHQEHVLPFGYWLEEREWVPVVHIGADDSLPPERQPNSQTDRSCTDPFDPPQTAPLFAVYSLACNRCHTTFPLGDTLLRKKRQIGLHSPVSLHLSVPDYLADSHPELWNTKNTSDNLSEPEIAELSRAIDQLDARDHAVTLGISCEACHMGCKEHAEGKLKRPSFFPNSPNLFVETDHQKADFGRSNGNINLICGRCHSGTRPTFAAGMATWNSTEAYDAIHGACYSQLTCVDCHEPHESIGSQWSLTAAQDDALCLKCHQKYAPVAARQEHTHHPHGSDGSRCMNCHMPRLNEGMQDVVRTHMIFSPTNRDMIEANHPNACNQCHTDRPIDWTLQRLQKWYGANYSEEAIAESYTDRQQPVAIGWLKHNHESVRMIGADVLIRAKAKWALPDLLQVLDDPFLLNRQFAQRGLQRMLDIQLKDYGYRFYMTPEERQAPLSQLRASLLPDKSAGR